MRHFSMSVASTNGYALVRLIGELDLQTAPDLSQLVSSLDPGHDFVAVDLSDLTFIDSRGIRALMSARHNGQPLALICPDRNRNISRVLEIAEASRAMPIYKRLEELLDDGQQPLDVAAAAAG
jgi:anti-anti-sigma factor